MTPDIVFVLWPLLLIAGFTAAQMLIVYLVVEAISRIHYYFRRPRS